MEIVEINVLQFWGIYGIIGVENWRMFTEA